jgi:hypothetical protein
MSSAGRHTMLVSPVCWRRQALMGSRMRSTQAAAKGVAARWRGGPAGAPARSSRAATAQRRLRLPSAHWCMQRSTGAVPHPTTTPPGAPPAHPQSAPTAGRPRCSPSGRRWWRRRRRPAAQVLQLLTPALQLPRRLQAVRPRSAAPELPAAAPPAARAHPPAAAGRGGAAAARRSQTPRPWSAVSSRETCCPGCRRPSRWASRCHRTPARRRRPWGRGGPPRGQPRQSKPSATDPL